MKTALENYEITAYWCAVSSSYPRVTNYVMRMLLPFGSTYLCEAAFSALVAMKSKCRSRLNVEIDLVCTLSCIKPRISIPEFLKRGSRSPWGLRSGSLWTRSRCLH